MRRVTALWEWLREENVACLSQVIKWRGDSVFYVLGDPQNVQGGESHNAESGLLAAPRFRGEMLARFRPGDCLLPARYLLQRKINEKLKTYSSAAPTPHERAEPARSVSVSREPPCRTVVPVLSGGGRREEVETLCCMREMAGPNGQDGKQRERWTRHAKCANMLRQRKWERERRKRRKEGALNAEEEG